MKYTIAALFAAITTAAMAQVTIQTYGNTSYINGPNGRTTTCSTYGNTVYCN